MIPKFRAWLREDKSMNNVECMNFDFEHVFLSGWRESFNIKDIDLMQSTGLKDKNGVEIFEGDIVLENGMEQVISLGEQRYEENFGDVVYYIGFNIFTKWGYSSIDPKEHVVIGNIYENPELLNLR